MSLKELLDSLSAAATPGAWNPDPKRLKIKVSDGRVAEGPLMSYLVGNRSSTEGMVVSLGSERVADHQLVCALVNSYRAGELVIAPLPEERRSEDSLECIFCKGMGRVAFTPEQRALAKRAVESQRNDVRTMDEKLRDGVRFVVGPGND